MKVKDGTIIYSKSGNIDQFSQNTISWPENAHCLYSHSRDLDFQCEHELRHDIFFIVEKFLSRWLQNYVYDKIHSAQTNHNSEEDYTLNNIDNNNKKSRLLT